MTRKQQKTLARLIQSSGISAHAVATIEKRSGFSFPPGRAPIAVGEGEADRVPPKAKRTKKAKKRPKKSA